MKQIPARLVMWLILITAFLASSAQGATDSPRSDDTIESPPYEVKNVPDVEKGTFRLLFNDSGQITRLELPIGTVVKETGKLPEKPVMTEATHNVSFVEILTNDDDPCVLTGYGDWKCW